MSLFNQILTALNNPEQEANPTQLSNIFQTVQQLSNKDQINPLILQNIISIAGNYTRKSLQEKRDNEGEETINNLIDQFAGNSANNQIVEMLFTTPQIENLTSEIEAKTGLNQGTIQTILPLIIPIILNLLKTGKNSNNYNPSNSVLNSFLDTDSDGDIDINDIFKLANNYLK